MFFAEGAGRTFSTMDSSYIGIDSLAVCLRLFQVFHIFD